MRIESNYLTFFDQVQFFENRVELHGIKNMLYKIRLLTIDPN